MEKQLINLIEKSNKRSVPLFGLINESLHQSHKKQPVRRTRGSYYLIALLHVLEWRSGSFQSCLINPFG